MLEVCSHTKLHFGPAAGENLLQEDRSWHFLWRRLKKHVSASSVTENGTLMEDGMENKTYLIEDLMLIRQNPKRE